MKTEKIFKNKDYTSNDGMLTTIWGPSLWHVLHTMSFNYPVEPCSEDKHYYMDFVLNLRYVLPCGKCRKNLRKNLRDLPLHISDMESRDTFSKYMYKLHEKVNKMLGKKSGLTYEDVRERYEHFRARCIETKEELRKETEKIDSICNKYKNKKNPICRKKTCKKQKKLEDGCTEPLYQGEKPKCVLNIVPNNDNCDTFNIDQSCMKKKLIPI